MSKYKLKTGNFIITDIFGAVIYLDYTMMKRLNFQDTFLYIDSENISIIRPTKSKDKLMKDFRKHIK